MKNKVEFIWGIICLFIVINLIWAFVGNTVEELFSIWPFLVILGFGILLGYEYGKKK